MAGKAIIVRGRLKGGRTIELDESVEGFAEDVEVILREMPRAAVDEDPESMIAVVQRSDVAAAMSGQPMEMEVLYRAQASNATGEDVTESPLVLVRRVPSAPMRAAEDVREDRDTPVDPIPRVE